MAELNKPIMERFYKDVSVTDQSGAYIILLDDRPIKIPSGDTLELGSQRLAEAIAAEWSTQTTQIIREKMPLNSLGTGAAMHRRDASRVRRSVGDVLRYVSSDLVCYRAESPRALKVLQNENWDPLIKWFDEYFHVGLKVTNGVMAIEQADATRSTVEAWLRGILPDKLFGLRIITEMLGSTVIATALCENRLSVDAAFAASRVDEAFQSEQWGEDPVAAERAKSIYNDLQSTTKFLQLL